MVAQIARIFSNEGPLGPPLAHAQSTVFRLLAAWVAAFVLGTLLGVAAGRFRWFFDFSRSLVWIVMAIPSVVWVFIFLIIFGISNIVPIAALVLLLGAPVFIGSAEGVRSVSRDLIEMSDSYKVGPWQKLVDLYLPSIAPYMVSNARVSFSLGIKIVIIAEVIGLPTGVGILVQYWSDSLYMAPVVAWGVLLMALGLAVDRFIFGPLERAIRREPGRHPA
ncbi:NitT/TauT family transport system permease protein OS=Castellaniella defragrans OX=75697 GN=HNR28_002747 PE=3 SV=1 [Castellaniella defragrans]